MRKARQSKSDKKRNRKRHNEIRKSFDIAKMVTFKIFHGGQELNVSCDHRIDGLVKVASQNEHMFLLTASKELFYGSLSGASSRASIQIDLIRNDINDIDCSNDSIYVVDVLGAVQHCPLMAFSFDKHWNDVPIVNSDTLHEVGGMTSRDPEPICVANVNCNNDGVLFTTHGSRELYGMGSFGEVCTSDQPMRIAQFTNYEVLKIAMGKNFALVLTCRRDNRKTSNAMVNGFNGDTSSLMSSTLSLNTIANSRVSKLTESVSDMSDLSLLDQSLASKNDETFTSQNADRSVVNVDDSLIKPDSYDITVDSISSEYNSIAFDIEPEINKLQRTGNALMRTYLWSFGSENTGRLGVGDHTKRKQAVQIVSLGEQGVRDISCGDDHAAALTLDGRLYLWGDNSNEQISHWMEVPDYSSPKRYYKSEQSVLQVQCGQYSTYILQNNLDRFEFSRNKHFASIPISTTGDPAGTDFTFLANKQLLVMGDAISPLQHEKSLKFEQQFMQDVLQVDTTYYSKFAHSLNRNGLKHAVPIYKDFFRLHQNIAAFTAVNIQTMLAFARGIGDASPVSIACVCNHQEFIHVYRAYTKRYCEIICSSDYQKTCSTVIPSSDFTAKFLMPTHHISNYIELINELMTTKSNGDQLKPAYSNWMRFRSAMNAMVADADKTLAYWHTNVKLLPPFLQTASRRIVVDSKELPLKLLPTSRFTSNWFILFNDVFCHSTGSNSTIKQYPLKALWLSSVSEKDANAGASSSTASGQRKYALKIITPEEQFVVSAQSSEVKMRWFQLIDAQIRMALGKVNAKNANLVYRVTTHTFSDKHKTYPNCKYIGQWYLGKMHGTGHLEWADGRVFTGQFDMNVINGQGRLVVPNVSCYEGSFINGKYHGCGTMKLQHLNGTIQGCFKNGQEHGHCTLIDDHKTYYGEYQNGARNGYGVLDDSNSGEKYMGMFQDDKRNGPGVCITGDGRYFEGIFVDNELNGNGVAIFNQGMYYEGDMLIHAPNGRGTLFLPAESMRVDNCLDSDERKAIMIGNILSGNLGGSWEDVKINSGSIATNREMPKYSQLFGTIQIDGERKWLSLFSDWENEVFGEGGLSDRFEDNYELVWDRIEAYIRRAKQIEALRTYITSSAVLFESGQSHRIPTHQSHSDHFLGVFYDTHDGSRNHFSRQSVSNSGSLRRINGKNYKSISNEFLSGTNAFGIDQSFECNNNSNRDVDEIDGDDDSVTMASLTLPSSMASKSSAPGFGAKLDKDDIRLVRDYLTRAFKNQHHPLGVLNAKISFCFYTSYGCWKVKPNEILSTQAMKEWESISKRIYDIVRHLFPALPQSSTSFDDNFISHRSLLYPILLSDVVYSTLFVLYANKCSKRDEIYRQRVLYCDKKNDTELMDFLKISSNYLKMVQHDKFQAAIGTLRQVKEKFCPREMLKLIEQTYRHVEMAAEIVSRECQQNDETPPPTSQQSSVVLLNADNMMPLSIFLLLRASIPHLGTEILLLEDLMGSDFEFVMKGFAGYCFTTIKAAYQHIIHDTFLQQ